MSRYPRRSEYDLSQSYAARAGPRYQSSSGAETEHYASTESLSASSNEIHQTKAYPRIAPRTPAFDSPGDATPATQNRSPISTQGLANAQRSCPHDSFSARAAHVNSKTIVLRKEVSPVQMFSRRQVPTVTELFYSAVNFRIGTLKRHSESGNELTFSVWSRKLRA